MVAKFSGKLLVTDCELLLEPSFNYETCQNQVWGPITQSLPRLRSSPQKLISAKLPQLAQLIQDINLHKLYFQHKIIYHLIPLRIWITSVHTQSGWSLEKYWCGNKNKNLIWSPPWCWWASTRQCWCSPCCPPPGAGATASGSPGAQPDHILSSY